MAAGVGSFLLAGVIVTGLIIYRYVSRFNSRFHAIYTGRIQCEVLTALPFCFSWIKRIGNVVSTSH